MHLRKRRSFHSSPPRPPRRLLLLLLLWLCCMSLSTRLFASMSAQAAKAKLVFPAPQKQTATLFFLHGLGDSADGGWSEVIPEFQSRFPFLKVVLPNAPMQPVTLNGGMKMPSWHDICSLSNLDKEDFKGLDSSQKTVESLLTDEIASGTPSQRILLGGFSQGAAVSLFTGLQFAQPLGGIIALSGYLPYNKPAALSTIVHESNKATPILMCHGEADAVVRFTIGQRSFAAIQEARKENLTFKSYKNMGHHSSDQEMKDVTDWMEKVLTTKS